ncbi:hypothetical protein KMW28_24740 [Flammeovirga yaeyamensis]|uniref:Uncharacterized protein n=1 Tax=Flammeovirga yaeyamensis TaxID=367791 RepID=A0AAX1NAR6_9BACT|nr:hypothetical protein [Flammeovirga yaeyamensis]MBB3699503.1 hypothetical protein [Flammeovirga yaeyamensis]NMF35240.1 hypothetical protein [Flammeovirga yaeyamensis]QWG04101.1 hypothetical protein KMW28_24740 [Flammeovirga yaeyamensis]
MDNNNSNNPDQEELNKLNDIIKNNNKTSRISSIIGLIALSIGVAFTTFNLVRVSDKVETNEKEIEQKKIKITQLADIVEIIDKKEKKVDVSKRLIVDFFESLNSNKEISIFFSDTVARYYLKEKISRIELKEISEEFQLKYPRAKTEYDINDIIVNVNNIDSTEIFIETAFFKDSLKQSQDIIYQFKTDQKNNIFFIRNLIPD